MATKKPTIKFEESLKKIEILINEIEQGKISIDEVVEKFEMGKNLLDQLTSKLDEIEKKVLAIDEKTSTTKVD